VQTKEEIAGTVNTRIIQKIPVWKQIIAVLDVILVGFLMLRLSTAEIDRGYIDWMTNVLFWSALIVTALLLFEVLLMSFILNRLKEAPIVMWGLFFILIAVDTLIVIIVLIYMRLLAIPI